MLRSFRFANHRSFRDEHELVLLPAYDRARPVVPVAALYGANASGKSTVADALRFMRQAVIDSYPRWEPGEGVPSPAVQRCRSSWRSTWVSTTRVGRGSSAAGTAWTMRSPARGIDPTGEAFRLNPSTGVWRLVERIIRS